MRRVVLSAGAFALLAAFSLAPLAKETKSESSEAQIACKDGTTSHAEHMRGACSGHGGVDKSAASAAASEERSSNATASHESKSTRELGAGAGKVWVNEKSKVYHCQGDPWYGKTKRGEYMSESEAKDHGFHPDHGKSCAERSK